MRVHYNTGKPVDLSRLDRVAQTLYGFGYDVQDAESLSRRIVANLDNYLSIIERPRLANQTRPTQTSFWKDNDGNVRI